MIMNEQTTLASALAAVLRAEKAMQRLTIKDLVERTGISKGSIDRHLNERTEVSVDQIAQWAAGLGMTASELLAKAEDLAGMVDPEDGSGGDVLHLPKR